MPLYKSWDTQHGKVAVWKIEEPEAFFVDAIGTTFEIKSEKRRIERLAGRFLLQQAQPGFPIHAIAPDEHDKPRLPGNKTPFSISHSWPYVAVMINDNTEAGLDLQVWHPRMLALQHKFLSEAEQALFKHDEQLIMLAWCAKEAVYKWNGRRGLDFIEHMTILDYTDSDMTMLFRGGRTLRLHTFLEAEFAYAGIATP